MVEQVLLLNGGARSASETSRLIRAATDLELGHALSDHRNGADSDAVSANLVFGDFYALAARDDGKPSFEAADEQVLRSLGRSDKQIADLRRLVKFEGGSHVLSDYLLEREIGRLGVPFNQHTVKADRISILTGWSHAQHRAACIDDPSVQASEEPGQYLLEHGERLVQVAGIRAKTVPAAPAAMAQQSMSATNGPPAVTQPVAAGPMLTDVIDPVVNDIIARGNWSGGPNGTGEDARRLIKEIAWVVGDYSVSTYTQTHISAFERELRDMPKSIRVQKIWHETYGVAKARFPKLTKVNRRNKRTINKDLAYISTFVEGMVAAGHWRDGQIKPLKLSHGVTLAEKRGARPPWSMPHIAAMFSSPIYVGNDGPKRRLVNGAAIYQDATYWVLPHAYFTVARREEVCGALVTDIVVEGTSIPHIIIQPNHLRPLKSLSSERTLPIHPRLIALGFLDYVERMKVEGHLALYPELWVNGAKRGGDQYYAVSWSKQMAWLAAQAGVTVPLGTSGKKADFHSLRATGLSQLDRHDINQNIVADIAGHARKGVTAQSYQDLVASGGLDDALNERLQVMLRLPDPTHGLLTPPSRFLPLALRSR